MVAGALLTNGLPLWSGNIIFFNVPEVILCVAVFGILVGLVNGAVITRFGVAPFICTLGMMYVARGSALLFNDGSTYPNLNGMETLGNTGFIPLVLARFRHLSTNLADDWLFDFRLLDHD